MAQDTVEQNPVEDKQKTETSQEAEKKRYKKGPIANFFYLNFTRKGRLRKTRDSIKDLARPENNYKMISKLAYFLLIGHTMFFHKWIVEIRPGDFKVPNIIPFASYITMSVEWTLALVIALFIERMMINSIANRLKVRIINIKFRRETLFTLNWSVGSILALFSILISFGAYKPFIMKVIETFQQTYKVELGWYKNISIYLQTGINLGLILGVSIIIPLVIFLYSVKVVRQIKPGLMKKVKKDGLTKEQKKERNQQIFEDISHHLSSGEHSKLTYEAIAARFIDEEGKARITANGVRDLISRTARNKKSRFDEWQVEIARAYKLAKEEKNKK